MFKLGLTVTLMFAVLILCCPSPTRQDDPRADAGGAEEGCALPAGVS